MQHMQVTSGFEYRCVGINRDHLMLMVWVPLHGGFNMLWGGDLLLLEEVNTVSWLLKQQAWPFLYLYMRTLNKSAFVDLFNLLSWLSFKAVCPVFPCIWGLC